MKGLWQKFFDLKLMHKLLALYGVICLLVTACSGAFFVYGTAIVRRRSDDLSQQLVQQVAINLNVELAGVSGRVFSTYHLGNLLGAALRPSGGDDYSEFRRNQDIHRAQSEILYTVSGVSWVCTRDAAGQLYTDCRLTASLPAEPAKYLARIEPVCREMGGTLHWDVLDDGTVAVSRLVYNLDTMQWVGTVAVGLAPQVFADVADRLGLPQELSLILCDSSGDAMYHTLGADADPAAALEAEKEYVDESGVRYLCTQSTLPASGLRLVQLNDLSGAERAIRDLALATAGLCLATLALVTLLTALLLSRLDRNVRKVMQGVQALSEGKLDTRLSPRDKDEIGRIALAIDQMAGRIQDLVQKVEEDAALIEKAKYQRLMSQYHVLQSQMNPHFLFNTLETINALAKMHGDEQIGACTRKLAKLSRSNLERTTAQCPLSEEIEYIETYVAVYEDMYPGRFTLTENWDRDLDETPVPTFFLQPIVENAILHGLGPKVGHGHLHLEARLWEDHLLVVVEDDGVGMDPATLTRLLDSPGTNRHFGLCSVHQRIRLLYGEEYGLEIVSKPGCGTCVKARLPI